MATARVRSPWPGACPLCAGTAHVIRPGGEVVTCPCMPAGYVSPFERAPRRPRVADVEQLPADGTPAEGQEDVAVPQQFDPRPSWHPGDRWWLGVIFGLLSAAFVIAIIRMVTS